MRPISINGEKLKVKYSLEFEVLSFLRIAGWQAQSYLANQRIERERPTPVESIPTSPECHQVY